MAVITQEIIDDRGEIEVCCEGCDRVTEDLRCSTYLYPQDLWAHGGCGLASHISRGQKSKLGKVRVGQQKQAKHR